MSTIKKPNPTFKVFDKNTEVIGHTWIVANTCIQSDQIKPIVEQFRVEEIKPESWYPLQDYLDFLKAIYEQPNSTLNFVSLGMDITKKLEFPPEFNQMPFSDILANGIQGYDMYHRGGDYGSMTLDQVTENHFKYVLVTPYPDDYMYGTIYGIAKRFVPQGKRVIAKYDDSITRQDFGGKETRIDLFVK